MLVLFFVFCLVMYFYVFIFIYCKKVLFLDMKDILIYWYKVRNIGSSFILFLFNRMSILYFFLGFIVS